jgi:hypothetical protein
MLWNHRPVISSFSTPFLNASTSVASVALLMFSGCLAGRGQDSWQHYQNGGMFDVRWVSLSPDGEYLTYPSPCTGHGDIYVIKSGTTNPLRLTESDDFESSPLFTPDGERIAYVREHDHCCHVWLMDRDGRNATQLTKGDFIDSLIGISGDGRFLLLSRAKPSLGLGLTAHSFVMRLDDPTHKLMSVGDVALISGDSRFIVYWESGVLWRKELDDNRGTPRRVNGTGQLLDVSHDGKLILTVRMPTGTQWSADQEIWVVDIDGNTEKELAKGLYGVFFGPKSTHVLYFTGYEQIPHVTDVHGVTRERIACALGYKTGARLCLDGRGAVLAASLQNRRPDYDVLFIDFESRKVTTIASLGCGKATFRSPLKTARTNNER